MSVALFLYLLHTYQTGMQSYLYLTKRIYVMQAANTSTVRCSAVIDTAVLPNHDVQAKSLCTSTAVGMAMRTVLEQDCSTHTM